MADGRNPFERVFNPDGGGLGGLIGSAFGVQTERERYGDSNAQAMQELSKIQQEGQLTPQQTILKFMQTPAGMQLFTSGDPKAMDTLSKWAATVQAPTPQVTAVGPGSQPIVTQPGGYTALPQNPAMPTIHGGGPGQRTLVARSDSTVTDMGTQPSTQVQDFLQMVGLGKLAPEKIQELATIWATPDAQRTTDKQAAVQALVASGKIDPVVANKILGGIIQVKPVFNPSGENTGLVQIIDLSNPQSPQVNVITPNAGTGGTIGATAPTKENPAGVKDPDKLTMFLGTGIWPQGLSYLDSTVRSVIAPNLDVTGGEGQKATNRNRYLDNLRFALTLFPEGDGKTNKVIEEAQKLLSGKFTDNLDAVRQGIRLHDLSQTELAADERITMAGTSKDQYNRAQRRIEGWRTILRALPDRADMEVLEDRILKGTAGAQTLGTGVRAGYNAISQTGQAVSAATQNTPLPPPKPQDAAQPQSTVAPAEATQPQSGRQPAAPKNEDPGVTDTKTPALEQQGIKDIQTMPVAKLLKIDPTKLTPVQRKALLQRIEEIRKKTSVRN